MTTSQKHARARRARPSPAPCPGCSRHLRAQGWTADTIPTGAELYNEHAPDCAWYRSPAYDSSRTKTTADHEADGNARLQAWIPASAKDAMHELAAETGLSLGTLAVAGQAALAAELDGLDGADRAKRVAELAEQATARG